MIQKSKSLKTIKNAERLERSDKFEEQDQNAIYLMPISAKGIQFNLYENSRIKFGQPDQEGKNRGLNNVEPQYLVSISREGRAKYNI